jgi:hypothetical protein
LELNRSSDPARVETVQSWSSGRGTLLELNRSSDPATVETVKSCSSGRGTLFELNRSSDPATILDCSELDLWQRNSVRAEQEF